MEQYQIEFHVAEYNGLRAEIALYSKQRVNAVIYTLIANATLLAFIIANVRSDNQFGELMVVAAWLPLLLIVSGWTYYYENTRNINRIAHYCMLLEDKFALLSAKLGWEHYLKHKDRPSSYFRAKYFYNTLFIIQFILAIYVGILVTIGLHTS